MSDNKLTINQRRYRFFRIELSDFDWFNFDQKSK
jgi:hypothetical protein